MTDRSTEITVTVRIRTTAPNPAEVAKEFEALLRHHYLPGNVKVTGVVFDDGGQAGTTGSSWY